MNTLLKQIKKVNKTHRWVLCLNGSASTCKWQITKAIFKQNEGLLRAALTFCHLLCQDNLPIGKA